MFANTLNESIKLSQLSHNDKYVVLQQNKNLLRLCLQITNSKV